MNAERESRSKVVPAARLPARGGLLLTLFWVSAAAGAQTKGSPTDARSHLAAARCALQNSDVQKAKTELELALK